MGSTGDTHPLAPIRQRLHQGCGHEAKQRPRKVVDRYEQHTDQDHAAQNTTAQLNEMLKKGHFLVGICLRVVGFGVHLRECFR